MLAELSERIDQADRAGRRVLPDGSEFRHWAIVWLASIKAGRPVDIPCPTFAAHAGPASPRPPLPALPASGRVTIG